MREFPLNNVKICGIYDNNPTTKNCPPFPRLIEIFQQTNENVDQAFFIAPNKPW